MQPLTKDAVFAHLRTRWLGRSLHCFDLLASTNTTAREMAAADAPHGTVVMADAQSQGRGRLGRSWASPPGTNLYLSAILRAAVPAERLAQISLVAGVAVCTAIRDWCPASIKWPNDVIAGDRKVAGILAELEGADPSPVVVLGIGVNVNAGADDFPPELREKAGSIRLACGAPVDRAQVAARLLAEVERWYDRWARDGFAPVAAAWRALAPCVGRPIRVAQPGDTVREGLVVDIDDDGALRLRDADGREHRVVAGDVTVLGGYES
jgi:BirA family biotin operon repressor/biotin-[acetyl-CoA-carboxylase] ligase